MNQKQSIRSKWLKKLAAQNSKVHWGKAAEKLRGLQPYHNAATVFATPHESLHQARVNCLVDGKDLLMPGPGIRDGFFLLTAPSIPFKDISMAVTFKGLKRYGQPLKDNRFSQHPVDMLLADSLAVDLEGGRIGAGDGFFDLGCALLCELDGLRHDADILTFVRDDQISPEPLPQDKWDIKVNWAVTPDQVLQFEPSGRDPRIFWDMLSRDRIKRIEPLWKLYKKGSRGEG